MCQPKAPDTSTVINQQTESNRDTAITQQGLNLINQTDAAGNTLGFQQIGTWADGTPRYSATQSLSAAGQELLKTNQGTAQNLASLAKEQSGRLSTLLNKPLDFSGLPAAGSLGDNDYSADRTKVEEALFSRLNPQLDREREAFETSLVNRGIRPGSKAYMDEMQRMQMGVNDQRTSVVLGAGQEQNRLQGLKLNEANFNNSNRANALNELLTQRSLPLNELLAVAGQGQVQTPQFAPTPSTGVGGVDTAGINQQNFANQQNQWSNNQSILGGLFSAGASLLPLAFSDRRLKTNIEDTGERVAGVPVKTWDWKDGGSGAGVIAQELERKHPELVDNTHPSGFKRVNYMGLLQQAGAA